MVSRYTSNPDYELNLLQSLCSARAFETETVLIHTNPGGSRAEGFMGGSGVWAPLMGKVGGYDKESGDVGEVGVKIVELDLGVLSVSSDLIVYIAAPGLTKQDARELYKIREDAAIRNAT
jgi:predicted amidohydrolase